MAPNKWIIIFIDLLLMNMGYSQHSQYSNMTCFHESFCICLDSVCQTMCTNGFCQNKEFVCTDNVEYCGFSCQDDQECKNAKFYMASKEFHLNCIGSNSCNNVMVNCGIPETTPGQLITADFDDPMEICQVEAFFASSIIDSFISCNGNINDCHIDSKAATLGGIYSTEFECGLENGTCEMNCAHGCYDSNYFCDTLTDDNQCKCNGCETGVNIEMGSHHQSNTTSSLNGDNIFDFFSTDYNMGSTTTTSAFIIDVDTENENDDKSPNFNLADGTITNLEILYYIVLGAGACLFFCICLCCSIVCFVRHSIKKKVNKSPQSPTISDLEQVYGQNTNEIYNNSSQENVNSYDDMDMSQTMSRSRTNKTISSLQTSNTSNSKKSKTKSKRTSDGNGNYNSDIDDEENIDEPLDEQDEYGTDTEIEMQRMNSIVNDRVSHAHIIDMMEEEKYHKLRRKQKRKNKHQSKDSDITMSCSYDDETECEHSSQSEHNRIKIKLSKPKHDRTRSKRRSRSKSPHSKSKSKSKSTHSKSKRHRHTSNNHLKHNCLHPDDIDNPYGSHPVSPSVSNPDPNEGSNDSSELNLKRSELSVPLPSQLDASTTRTSTTESTSIGPSCHKNPFLSPSAATAQFEAHTKQINELVQNYAMMQRQLLFTHQNTLAMQQQAPIVQNMNLTPHYPKRSQSLQQNNDNNPFLNSLQHAVKTQSQSLQNLKSAKQHTVQVKPKPNSLGIPPPPQPKPTHNHISLQMIKPSMRHKRTVTPSTPALPVVHDQQMVSILNGGAVNSMVAPPPSTQELNNMTQSMHRYASTHTDTSGTSSATSNTSCSSSSVSSSSSSSSSCTDATSDGSCSCSDCEQEHERGQRPRTRTCSHEQSTRHRRCTHHTGVSTITASTVSVCNDTQCSCHHECTTTICSSSTGSSATSASSSTMSSSSSSSRSIDTYSSDDDDDDDENGTVTKYRKNVNGTVVIHDQTDQQAIRELFNEAGVMSEHQRQLTGNSNLTISANGISPRQSLNGDVQGTHKRYRTFVIHE
mmetsp:Transcript_77550/g.69417  ORF Transcript_77550/g.69417 Transcript_77550/m.69417 type:complete len:1029 (-) Transcript_77550:91-3177(-)